MSRAEPPELAQFLAPFPEGVVGIVRAMRARVLVAMPNAHEVVWDATNAVSLVFTPSSRWQDGICHIAAYARHVNLGFNDGASLEDPLGILDGTGARIRHVSLHTLADVGAPWVSEYLRAAMANAGVTDAAGDSGTTVRRSAGPKRRPTPSRPVA